MVSQSKKYSYDYIEKMISELSAAAGTMVSNKENHDTFMNWDQIKQMANAGITFGSHTVNHRILTKISAEEAEKEIAESKRNIEDNLKDTVIAFSYPNGNYNKDIIELVKSHGYAVAFSTENGHVSASDDPFTVKRINIHNDVTKNIPMFLSTILGIF
jgi:peptidoglycan/xylan/chitin deacetylase (PgdA/CDA1 family)